MKAVMSLVSLFVFFGLLAAPKQAQAVMLNCAFYAPAGKYVICLQEQSGATVRWNYDLYNNNYNGQYTYRWSWYGITGGRSYRIVTVRYTSTSCQVKYGQWFYVPSWYSYYNAPTFYW